jgi:MFS family permease
MTSSVQPAASSRVAFHYPDFRLLLGARFASTLATQMQSVAIAWQVYELTHRPLDLGFVGLAQFLPVALLTLVSGQAADRFDRRAIVLLSQTAQVVCSLALFAYARLPSPAVDPIYALLVLLGVARAFNGPANQALLPELVPPEHFGNAVAWSQSSRYVAIILGPSLGGLLYAAFDGPGVYIASALLFFAAALLTLAIATRTGRLEKREVSVDTLLAGIRYVYRSKLVLGCISLDLFAVLLGGAVALLPIYARDILHVGPTGLGLLRTAPAVGAALMGVVLAYRPLRRRAGASMLASVACFGLATIVFGLSRSFVVSLVALALTGAFDMVSVVVRGTLVQLATPPAMRGRVGAVNVLFIGASNELGEFESGVTAALLGTVPAVVLGGLGTCVIVALFAWWFPELRKVESLSE